MISGERLSLALKQLDAQHGFEFERFANAFLTADFPNLRPVGGIHDGARDAFIHSDADLPGSFVQHSVTQGWASKIRDTIKDLRKNGHTVRELVYGTPLSIQSEVDELKRQLRKEGVSLDVRDHGYFVAHANSAPGTMAAAENLASRFVDPLITPEAIARATTAPALTTHDERVAATFLACAMQDRNPEKGLTKFTYDSLVTFALRDATPESLVPRAAVIAFAQKLTPSTEAERCKELVESALTRLTNRGVVKHHTKDDAFTLSSDRRKEMKDRLARYVEETAVSTSDIEARVTEVAARLGIDFDFGVSEAARDAGTVLDQLIALQSRHAAHALIKERAFFFRREDSVVSAAKLYAENNSVLRSAHRLNRQQFLDLVPAVVDDLALRPPESLLRKLRHAGNAYCLLFALREAPDVQVALQKVFRAAKLLVDTSVLVPCLAENLLPKEQQRMSNLLRVATESGIEIFITDDILNELESHLDRVRYHHSKYIAPLVQQAGARAVAASTGSLVSAFLTHGAQAGVASMEEFISRFKGVESPKLDLIEYLSEEMGIGYDARLEEEYQAISHVRIGELTEIWKTIRHKRPDMEEGAFDRLIHHDVRSVLLTQRLRQDDPKASAYGASWWFLTRDRSAYRVDATLRDGRGPSLCMSPEFFVRYLSMRPATSGGGSDLLPVSVELASLDLVPVEVRDEAVRLFEGSKNVPEYLRRRQLRELVNRAYSEREEDGVDKADLLLGDTNA